RRFCSRLPRPPSSTLLPYTTLFRSAVAAADRDDCRSNRRIGSAFGRSPARIVSRCLLIAAAFGAAASVALAVVAPERLAADELRSEEHTSELQSRENLVCRLLLEKK